MKKFTRRIENFTCEACGTSVEGNGYTDHCPACLVGKHVDIMPGDRAETCHGLLDPILIEVVRDGFKIHYRCRKCHKEVVCKSSDQDSFQTILSFMKRPVL